jgi:class 3 adenylate cyclase
MASKADLETYIHRTFALERWTVDEGRTVPNTEDIALSNSARHFKLATFLYADLDGSTQMVDTLPWQRCAEIYKTYLYCASRMIRDFEGEVAAFDGDRVMGVFLGDMQSTNAVRCALRINWILQALINPLYQAHYKDGYSIGHSIGIDASETRCCRTGVRGDNDLVWVGSAANIAAKLTGIGQHPIWITNTIFDRIDSEVKVAKDGRQMWEARSWTPMNNRLVYCSHWWWSLA